MIAPDRSDTIALLRNRFGDRVSTSAAVLEQHGRGESHHLAAPPDAVVFAQTTEEVAEILALCDARRVPVIAFGAGTSLEGHVAAVNGGVCIDLTGMNRVLRVSAEDMDCTVQAGVSRLQLNSELRHTGLFFPLDPGADATIGGMAATRASGTNAVRYGTMREAVLGLTVALADGQVIHTGGRARKSAAGYDLTRLFVGSEGTLGVMTEITLRLQAIPEAVAVAVSAFPDVSSAVQTVVAITQSGIPIARVELLDQAQMRAVNRFGKHDYPEKDTLFFEFHGAPQSVAEQVERVREIAADQGGLTFAFADRPEDRSAMWKARHDAFYATTSLRPGAKGWSTDVCVPIGALPECLARTQEILRDVSLPATIVGHVGDGNYHVIFALDPADPAEVAQVSRLSGALAELALSLGGTCTGEHGIGLGKLKHMAAEHGAALGVMRAIKQALDPHGTLNPGKVLPPVAESR